MSRTLDEKVELFQANGFEYITEESSSEEGELSVTEEEEDERDEAETSKGSLNVTFSDRTFDEDDREFEVGQVLEQHRLPKSASQADKKLRAAWARNLNYMLEKIEKYEKAEKTVRKEANRRRRKLSSVLKQLGKLSVRKHYPGMRF